MTVPADCYLVTTRKGFHPEKTVSFELSEKSANLQAIRAHFNGSDYFVSKCVIMPKETFEELCPDWAESQDFVGKIPKEDGYYWYVDKEYPLPRVGMVALNKFYDSSDCRQDRTEYVGSHYFIGPMIPSFPCHKVKIVR